MLSPTGTRLEVWGDPVAHSRSPQLHAAAYRVLGLDWTYGRRRVSDAAFAAELAGLSDQWRGLSLTMPLKSVAFDAASSRDRRADLTGAVNTLLLTEDGPRGFNTDVGGIVRALQEEGVREVARARIVGAGATATSALVALAELGVERVEVVARRAAAVQPLEEIGASIGVEVIGVPFDHGPAHRCTRHHRDAAGRRVGAGRRPPMRWHRAGDSCWTSSTVTGRPRWRARGRAQGVRRRRDWGCCCTRLCSRCASS